MTKKDFPLLAALDGEVIAVDSTRQSWFESCLSTLVQHQHAEDLLAVDNAATSEDDGFWPSADNWCAQYRPYLVQKGILTVPVMGVLLNRFSYQFGHWATGYTYIERALRRGLDDPEVKGIVLMCDTPGGEVSGLYELTDKLFQARGRKPILGIASDRAYSAGYAVISSADMVSVVRTGGVGGIGVMTLHLDFSEQLNQEGVKATFIFAGERKVDGNNLQPLSKRAKDRIKQRVDKAMDLFVALVVRNRGMEEAAVRGTEADCLSADEAIEIGLADKIETREGALISFTELCTSGSGEDYMKTYSEAEFNTAVEQAKKDGAASASTENASANQTAKSEGEKIGATAERKRINDILASDEAKVRPVAARAVALESEMALDAAKAFLARMPEEKKVVATEEKKPTPKGNSAVTQAFETLMSNGNPQVGADDEAGDDEAPSDQQLAGNILGAYRNATGTKPPAAA